MEMREMEAMGEDTRSIQDSTLAAGTEVKAENASDAVETSDADAATPSPEATQTAPEPEAEAEVETEMTEAETAVSEKRPAPASKEEVLDMLAALSEGTDAEITREEVARLKHLFYACLLYTSDAADE